jgi:hypothetical protein
MPEAPIKVVDAVRVFHGRWVDDGYDFIQAAERGGWRTVAGWGEDGWDLGDWPYVVFVFREVVDEDGKRFQRACYVEGDIRVESFATAQAREEATDVSAAFYWRRASKSSIGKELYEACQTTPEDEPLPARFRGPYRARPAA